MNSVVPLLAAFTTVAAIPIFEGQFKTAGLALIGVGCMIAYLTIISENYQTTR